MMFVFCVGLNFFKPTIESASGPAGNWIVVSDGEEQSSHQKMYGISTKSTILEDTVVSKPVASSGFVVATYWIQHNLKYLRPWASSFPLS